MSSVRRRYDGVQTGGRPASAFSDNEARELERLARRAICLEVGAWVGFSAICMARVAKRVVSVDWHRGDANHPGAYSLPTFVKNLEHHNVERVVAPIVARSEEILPLLAVAAFDLVFIDGDHSYEAVLRDAELCEPLVKPGGALLFHDYGIGLGVEAVVDERYRDVTFGPDSLARVDF